MLYVIVDMYCIFFFFQAEDGIRDLVRSRGLGDVYKRQPLPAVRLALCQRAAPDRRSAENYWFQERQRPVFDLSLIHI